MCNLLVHTCRLALVKQARSNGEVQTVHSLLVCIFAMHSLQLPLSGVRERPESAEIYMGVAAPKRKRVEEQQIITEIPKVRCFNLA